MARRREIMARVARTEEELRWLGANVEPEPEDEAQEETATQLLARLDERDQASVAAIDRALSRMASGNYGRCDVCGRPLTVGRLEALPEAVRCVSCNGHESSEAARHAPS